MKLALLKEKNGYSKPDMTPEEVMKEWFMFDGRHDLDFMKEDLELQEEDLKLQEVIMR